MTRGMPAKKPAGKQTIKDLEAQLLGSDAVDDTEDHSPDIKWTIAKGLISSKVAWRTDDLIELKCSSGEFAAYGILSASLAADATVTETGVLLSIKDPLAANTVLQSFLTKHVAGEHPELIHLYKGSIKTCKGKDPAGLIRMDRARRVRAFDYPGA